MQFTQEQSRELAVMRYDALRAEFGDDMKHAGYQETAYRIALSTRVLSGLPPVIFKYRGDEGYMNPSVFFEVLDEVFGNACVDKVVGILKIAQSELWVRVQRQPVSVSGTRTGRWLSSRDINSDPQTTAASTKPQVPAGLIQFARTSSAIDAIRQDLIRCGFELEFQSLNGSKDADEVDEEALRDASWDAWHELSLGDTLSHMRSQNYSVGKMLEFAREMHRNHSLDELLELFKETLRADMQSVLEEAEESFRDDWEDNNRHDFTESRDVYGDLDACDDTRRIIDCGTDQSVDGGEIRTLGALTPMQFLSASSDLLDNNTFEVDTGCSFHIHLSVPGVTHTYGSQLQAEMIAYILDNKARLPESVRKRLVSEKLDHFAKLQISEDKFTAVHYHSRLRTWEFRLFGNVSDSSDARRCLILAIEAMRWAYRVKLGLEKSLVSQEVMANFRSVAKKARESGSSFKKERRSVAIEARHAA